MWCRSVAKGASVVPMMLGGGGCWEMSNRPAAELRVGVSEVEEEVGGRQG